MGNDLGKFRPGTGIAGPDSSGERHRETSFGLPTLSEESLRRAASLEALGRLVGGLAHELNNTLNMIRGYADLIEEDLPPDSKAVRNVRIVQEVSSGAGTMIRRLLAFGRPPAAEWRSQGVNALVRSTMAALQGPLGRDLEVVLDLKAEPDEVIADARLLAQALLNLAVNARDAMPQGGELRLETRRIRSDSPPFERIRLRVADNGVGMEPAVKQRAFEPFFTTKDPERGSGLGLAAVQGIVEQHGGTIRAESEPGRGTAFEIDLPAAAPRG